MCTKFDKPGANRDSTFYVCVLAFSFKQVNDFNSGLIAPRLKRSLK